MLLHEGYVVHEDIAGRERGGGGNGSHSRVAQNAPGHLTCLLSLVSQVALLDFAMAIHDTDLSSVPGTQILQTPEHGFCMACRAHC